MRRHNWRLVGDIMHIIERFKDKFPAPSDATLADREELHKMLDKISCKCLLKWKNRAAAYEIQKLPQSAYSLRYYAFQRHIELIEERK